MVLMRHRSYTTTQTLAVSADDHSSAAAPFGLSSEELLRVMRAVCPGGSCFNVALFPSDGSRLMRFVCEKQAGEKPLWPLFASRR